MADVAQAGLYPMAVVERLTGLTRRQIRYCEAKGLVHPARSPGGQRLFSPRDVERLMDVRHLREMGFYQLEEVRRLLESTPGISPRRIKESGRGVEEHRNSDARQHFEKKRLKNQPMRRLT